MGGRRVYVGGIPRGTRERDLERFFSGFHVGDILLKNTFAFVEFDSSRDAEDAVYEMNDRKLLNKRVTVEMARSTPRGRDRSSTSKYTSEPRSRGRQRGPLRTKHRLMVENLSSAVSWQSLKDYMRQAGEVTYGDAHRPHRNVGEVEFASRSDLKAAIRRLDGTELNGRRIRLVEDKRAYRDDSSGSSRSRSRSDSRGSRRRTRSRSRSRSPSRGGSRSCTRSPSRKSSHSRTRSPSRKSSHSRTRSPSRKSSHSRSRSPSRERSRSRTRSPRSRSHTESHSRTRSPSHVRARSHTESPSCVRSQKRFISRSGSVKRDVVRKPSKRTRSRSGSSKYREESSVHYKRSRRSRSRSRSSTKRFKSGSQGRDRSDSHKPKPENISPASRTQESHTPKAGSI